MNESYLTSNLYINFPFAENASRLSNEGPTIPINFLADAVIDFTYAAPGAYVSAIVAGVTGGDNFLDFFISDLASSALVTVRILKSQYQLQAIFSGANLTSRCVARFVAGNADFDAFYTAVGGGLTFPVAATTFSNHALFRSASKLFRFRVSPDRGTTWGPWREQIPLKLVAGSNMLFSPLVANDITQVDISVVPGAGTGLYDPSNPPGGIPAVDYVANIGGATPDSKGNLILQGDTCYRAALAPSDNLHAIQLINDCVACCQCSDYERVASMLTYIQELNAAIKAALDALLAQFNSLVSTWNSQLDTKRRKFYPFVTIMPTDLTGSAYWITIVLLNNKFDALTLLPATRSPNLTITIPGGFEGANDLAVRVKEEGADYASEAFVFAGIPDSGGSTSSGAYQFDPISCKKYGALMFQLLATKAHDPGPQTISFVDATNGISYEAKFEVPWPPPQISVTNPVNGNSYPNNVSISLTCTATPHAGDTITKVEYYANGTLIATANSFPWSANWTPTATGTYAIFAKAYTAHNTLGKSTIVTITVI